MAVKWGRTQHFLWVDYGLKSDYQSKLVWQNRKNQSKIRSQVTGLFSTTFPLCVTVLHMASGLTGSISGAEHYVLTWHTSTSKIDYVYNTTARLVWWEHDKQFLTSALDYYPGQAVRLFTQKIYLWRWSPASCYLSFTIFRVPNLVGDTSNHATDYKVPKTVQSDQISVLDKELQNNTTFKVAENGFCWLLRRKPSHGTS